MHFTGLTPASPPRSRSPVPCVAVEATLVHFSQPAQIEAFEVGGASAGVVTMSVGQRTSEALAITGSAIDRVVIKAPQNETLLLRFCFEPA